MIRTVAVAWLLVACGGDDADVVTPPAFAAWPMPNGFGSSLPHAERLQLDGDVARDPVTSLAWARTPVAAGNLSDAAASCRARGRGWRLPSRIELASIVDVQRTPTIDGDAFSAPADYFWTASAVAGRDDLVWTIYFGQGLTGPSGADGVAFARCVRGGANADDPRYEVTTELVTDRGTGLVWQRNAAPQRFAWSFAREVCDALELGGSRGFRLPSLRELQTIVDERAAAPAFDAAFAANDDDELWSSSKSGANEGSAYVLVADGSTALRDATALARVRCVR